MNKKLSKHEKAILDNLDRMLAGQQTTAPTSFLEEKLLQVLKKFEYTEQKKSHEQESTARLISNISHQIKTPVSALMIHLELAGDESLTVLERSESLEECKILTQRIYMLTENIFKVARLESGLISVQPTNRDLIPTILSVTSVLKPRIMEKDLVLDINLPEKLILPHDPIWTKEALQNILDNAIKYTGKGLICLSLEVGAIYTCITITDTGVGIKKEDYTKIFDRFYRVRETGTEHIEGTGLGLSIAREIMRQQGGNITVSSNNSGTTFSLFLQNR